MPVEEAADASFLGFPIIDGIYLVLSSVFAVIATAGDEIR